MRRVTITSGPEQGRTLDIEGEVVVGRSGADVDIADEELSRRHAVLRGVERGIEIEDLDSTNGTFVDGRRITEPVTVTSTARLELGASAMSVEVELLPAPSDQT